MHRLAVPCVVAWLLLAPRAAAAPAYPIVLEPDRPAGTVLLVHGGAWSGPNRARVQALRPLARRFAAAGFRAVVLEYGPGPAGYADVKAAARRWARGRGPLCLYGESAGGHLAVLAAERGARRDVDCVVAVAAPLDFATWNTTPAAAWHRLVALVRLGPSPIWDPASSARRLRAPTLAISTRNDPVVPPQQAASFGRRAGRPFRSITLGPGPLPSGHGTSSARELARAQGAQLRLLRAAVRRSS